MNLAARENSKDMVAAILKYNCVDIASCDQNNNIPLHVSAEEGLGETILLFLKNEVHLRKQLFFENLKGNIAIQLISNAKALLEVLNFCKNYDENLSEELIKFKTSKGFKLTNVCCQKGWVQNVILLHREFDIDFKACEGQSSPLHLAAKNGRTEVVRYLVKKCHVSTETTDENGFTPLILACLAGQTETFIALVKHQSDLNKVDASNNNVFHLAIKRGNFEIITELLNLLKPPATVATGKILETSRLREKWKKVFKKLIVSKNNSGESALMLAVAAGNLSCVKKLVELNKTALHIRNDSEETCIHIAAENGHLSVLSYLIEVDQDHVNSTNIQKNTAFHLACMKGNLEIAQLLFDSKLIDHHNEEGLTPLLLAAKYGQSSIVSFIMQKSKDCLMSKSDEGLSALDLAIEYEQTSTAMTILNSQNWRQAVRFPKRIFQQTTPTLKRMVNKMPSAFSKLLSDHILVHEEDGETCYEFQFSIVDDSHGTSKVGPMTAERFSVIAQTKRRLTQVGTDDIEVGHNNHPIQYILDYNRLELLSHPLPKMLLRVKWQAYARRIYFFNLFLYSLFLSFFTLFLAMYPAPYLFVDCENLNNQTTSYSHWKGLAYSKTNLRGFGYAALVFAVLRLFSEFFEFFSGPKNYLKNLINYIEVFVYIGAILVVLPIDSACGHPTAWQWILGFLVLLFGFTVLLDLLQKFPHFGIYVVMFFKTAKTIIDFMIIFMVFWICFALAFNIMLANQPTFSTVRESLVNVMFMMLGEYNYQGTFYPSTGVGTFPKAIAYNEATKVLFLLFAFVMSIIIMNLLVGLALNDVTGVRNNASKEVLKFRARLILQIDYSFIGKILKRKNEMTSIKLLGPSEQQLSFRKTLLRKFETKPTRLGSDDVEIIEKLKRDLERERNIFTEIDEIKEILNKKSTVNSVKHKTKK